jgi:hypothetical protein
MSAAGFDGSIRIDSKIDTTGFNSGLSSLAGTVSQIAGIVGVAFSVKALFDFSKASIQLASDAQVMQRRFDTTFGTLAAGVEADMQKIREATNFDKENMMGFAASLQGTFLALGFAGEKAAGMSEQLVQLSADMAVFYNVDQGEVIGNLRSAMTGYTRSLREYGIVLSDTAIKQEALALGIWDGSGALDAEQKAEAIYQIVLAKTALAQGSAQASTRTWAGQVRGLAATWEDFSRTFGAGLMTALQGILPLIQGLLNLLMRAATAFAQLMGILFGIREAIPNTASGIQNAADAAGDLADNTNAAGKAAKGALAAFDSLNVLQQAQGPAAVPVAATPVLGSGQILDYKQSVGELQQIWAIFINWFKQQPIFKVLIDWWNSAYELILAGLALLQGNWSGAISHFKKAAESFFLGLGELWKIWWNSQKTLWADIASMAQVAWDFIQRVAATAWDFIIGLWNVLAPSFKKFVIDPIVNAWDESLTWIGNSWNTTWTGIGSFVKGIINTIIGYINGMISAMVGGINAVIKGLDSISVTIPSWVPTYGGNSFGVNIPYITAPKIPLLATGAVIPPNSAFAAVLGDQTSGRNIEAPEHLIRQIIKEEIGNIKAEVTLNFAGSLAVLVQQLKPYIDKENIRIGNSLVRNANQGG